MITLSNNRVYQLLGEAGTYYGVRFGKNIPWVTEFPFGVIKDPQYVGSILSLLACLSWVPFQYILLWVLGYVFMMQVESKEDPSTRAKPLLWLNFSRLERTWGLGSTRNSKFFNAAVSFHSSGMNISICVFWSHQTISKELQTSFWFSWQMYSNKP